MRARLWGLALETGLVGQKLSELAGELKSPKI